VKNLQLLGFTHFIRLTRRNTLRKVVSALVGAKTEQYHRRRGQAGKSEPVTIDLDSVAIEGQVRPLLEVLRGYQEDEARIRGLLADQPLLELEYETDIQGSPLEAYRKTCSFLSLEPVQAEVRLVRTNPHPLGALIANLDEVTRTLSGSGFEWMLEEDPGG
jgi:hypothetical protein